MTIQVVRKWYSPVSVCSEVLIDDQFECYGLEPLYASFRSDLDPLKTYPIPAGTYDLVRTLWTKKNYVTPLLIGVPGHDGIRIHIGNWPSDSEGCLLLGNGHQEDAIDPKTHIDGGMVTGSAAAFEQFMAKFITASTITYR